MEWISVKDFLPGSAVRWCIVISKNKDDEIFSFMAMYIPDGNVWSYFDDDKNYENTMEIIYWTPLPNIESLNESIRFR